MAHEHGVKQIEMSALDVVQTIFRCDIQGAIERRCVFKVGRDLMARRKRTLVMRLISQSEQMILQFGPGSGGLV